jgi:hypothetical protein
MEFGKKHQFDIYIKDYTFNKPNALQGSILGA